MHADDQVGASSFSPDTSNPIDNDRKVLYTTQGLPFIIAGSGTLGWDQVRCSSRGVDRALMCRWRATWLSRAKQRWSLTQGTLVMGLVIGRF